VDAFEAAFPFEEVEMCATESRILVVGPILASTRASLAHLEEHGWGFQPAETLGEAFSLLPRLQYDVVLACENLADGRAYELIPEVKQRKASLLVWISLSRNCMWLPVVENGERTLGARGLNSGMLVAEIKSLLTTRDAAASDGTRSEFGYEAVKRPESAERAKDAETSDMEETVRANGGHEPARPIRA
jgi:DNA-binding response OmpR family regulator